MKFRVFSLIGLITAVVGVGCVKANSNTFAANQYKLPEQAAQVSVYFSLQFFCMKSGSIIGRFFNPILRQDVKCFGMNNCFPLAFGVPALAMIASAFILFCGRKTYVHKALSGNMFIRVCGCILVFDINERDYNLSYINLSPQNAIKEKLLQRKTNPRDHWLDYAEEKYGLKLVMETKMVLNALLMFVPIPVFWTLHMQQGSRWVFQGTRMNGDIGFYTIKPDQMIIFNSVFSLLLVPAYERVFYPLLAKVGIKTPLQKMTGGLICAAAAFVIAALIEIQIEKNFIHILWLVPQYFVLCMGEIMLYIQNLSFAYSEAPANMKSVMLAFCYLTMAVGNLFMVFISGTRIFESQVYEFLFFAGVMLIDMIIFIILAIKYKYVKRDNSVME